MPRTTYHPMGAIVFSDRTISDGASQHAEDRALLLRSRALWGVDRATVDWDAHADFLIARILAWGTWEEWQALFRLYSRTALQSALRHREMPPHIRAFWGWFWESEVRK